MEILSLVDRLENLITSSQPMPMTKRVLVREQEVLQIIDLMRAAVPEEIKQARRINQDREHLLKQAQAEASRIIAAAREEADRLINDEKMVQLALARGAEIEREAEDRARQLRDGADAYASETLRGLEEQLSSLQTQLDQTILSIHKGLETLSVRAEEGEEEEPEETLMPREDAAEAEAAWKEEDVAQMAPKRALRDEFPSRPAAFPRRPSAPLEQQAAPEAPRLSERKTFQQGKR
jgi:cell division septum initiation protein DivIVA